MKSSGCLDSSFGTPLTFPKEAFVEEVEMIRSDQLENDLVGEGQFATEKMMQEWGWTQLLDSLERHSTYLNMPCQACWQFQSTDIANITLLLTCQSIKISTLKTLIHRFTIFLGYFCVLSLRTRIDAVKADARRNPKTMMRPGRAKPCSDCMTHFHFQDRQVRESDLVLGRTLHQNSKEVSWHTRTCLGTCQS